MQFYDCHTHTDYSLDAHYPMEEMLKAAAESGLTGIAVTDHADIDFFEPHHVAERMLQDAEEMKARQAEWSGKLDLIRGVEIGQALFAPEEADRVIACGDYDFVIGAVHSVRKVGAFYSMSMHGDGPDRIDRLLRAYFREVEENVRICDFDTFPHMTYPLRYIRKAVSFSVDFNPYEREIREIMKILADRGKAYELNLKPYAPGDTAWLEEECRLLQIFREEGGEFVTIGTDAHVPGQIGYGLETGMRMLRREGFGHYQIYRNRNRLPIEIRLSSD